MSSFRKKFNAVFALDHDLFGDKHGLPTISVSIELPMGKIAKWADSNFTAITAERILKDGAATAILGMLREIDNRRALRSEQLRLLFFESSHKLYPATDDD